MNKLNIGRQVELPSLFDLREFEREYEITLPSDFKEFVLSYNAVDLDESIFFNGKEKYYIDVFYPLSKDYDLSLQFVFQNLRDYFQNEFLPFANDSGGWQYVLSLRVEDYGKIYLCRMDDVPPTALKALANSFTEFIDGLTSENTMT
ncbi:MAG TPA: SMI1/KNR4 family protein [Ohtaekwangia sp.]|uniref:SMI1/KNR4 family protein n=1 Tax=Ohtaekwangia sp. TaxID=2066019 RepID=UPI002F95F5D0